MSTASPGLPKAIRVFAASITSTDIPSFMGVSVDPGAMQFTVMLMTTLKHLQAYFRLEP
jgi:hypothetical protein